MITIKILKDSVGPDGARLTTFELTYPRIIHSEFMTHRCFARNSASSRAIPISKMIDAVHRNGDSIIEFWGAAQAGMQVDEALPPISKKWMLTQWELAAQEAVTFAGRMAEKGCAKQIANRLLEPFSHITVIATATDQGLANFFNLRCHPAAQQEFQVLAYRMLAAWLASTPEFLEYGAWHLPYGDDVTHETVDTQLRICTGRIARVSYLNQGGHRSVTADVQLHDRLEQAGHWSPFEHCAQVREHRLKEHETGCFGPYWFQYRKMFRKENQLRLDGPALLATKPSWISL